MEQIPGRAIVNSVNLEAGRDKLDRVVPTALAHGAALIALTIDEVGMAKTAQRKVEIAQRIKELCCDEHGLDPEVLIFDCLTFTLTTGDEEWRPSAVETIEGIRRIKAEIPDVKTSLGVSNVSFGVSPGARAVLNSVFLHHCVEAGLDLAMVNPNHITPYSEISDEERGLADDLVFNRREDALEQFIAHFESKGEQEAQTSANPTEGMEPEEALHFHILRRRKEGVEDWIDASVQKIGAVPTLNTVLLPAMKEVGDKFGAGELILPFVLQSAEVMKKAVARLELYLDKIEGYTKGTVVLATVFGDVHDIGKSLGQHDPHQQWLHGDRPRQAGADPDDPGRRSGARSDRDRPLGATRVHLQADARLHPGAARQGHAVPRADRRRRYQPRLQLPRAVSRRQGIRRAVCARRFLLQGRVRGSVGDGPADRRGRPRSAAREAADGATEFRAKGEAPVEELNFADDSVRSNVSTHDPIPTPPWWGVKEVPVDMDEVYSHLDTHVLFKLHWGGKGVKGEAWRELVEENFRPRLERMWASRTTCTRAHCSASSLATRRATTLWCSTRASTGPDATLDPADPASELTRFVCPRQPKGDRICLADFFRPAVDDKPPEELDVIAVQAVTVGSEVTELMAKLEADGEFAEQLFVHGLGVQTAEGLAEWLHWKVREMLSIPTTQGRRYSWGYPAVPEQSEHLKVEKLLDLDQIGMTISDGYAPIPEQSTLALDRASPAGDLLRHAPGTAAARRLARRRDQGLLPRPVAADLHRLGDARGERSAGWRGRTRGRARDGEREQLSAAHAALRSEHSRGVALDQLQLLCAC